MVNSSLINNNQVLIKKMTVDIQEHYCVVHCSVPDLHVAQKLAKGVIEADLAACVQIINGIQSYYKWDGDVACSNEYLLQCKLRSSHYTLLESFLILHHPYDVPEIIAMPIIAGHKDYLTWIDNSQC